MFPKTSQTVVGIGEKKIIVEGLSSLDDAETMGSKKKPNRGGGMSFLYLAIVSVGVSVLISSPLLYLVFTRLGLGSFFPPQPFLSDSKPILPESALEIVANLTVPPGNMAVSSKGRIFFNFHPEYKTDIKILELKEKKPHPFPSVEFQRNITTVLSMRIDAKDRLYLLDFANHGISGYSKLIGFDLRDQDKLVVDYAFPPSVAGTGAMLNDFQIDPKGEFIYIVDTSLLAARPGLIVYSVLSNKSYRVLSEHPSMYGLSLFINISSPSPPSHALTPHVVRFGPLGLKIHVDSVALDRTGQVLYYGAMTSNLLYSLNLSALHSANSSLFNSSSSMIDAYLSGHVKLVSSEKPVTDGLSSDGGGNLWLTGVEHSALFLALPSPPPPPSSPWPFFGTKFAQPAEAFKIVKVVQSERLLRWPDGLSFGPDGSLYITSSALQYQFLNKKMADYAPFHILKIPAKYMKNKELYGGRGFVQPPAGQ